MEWTRRRFLLDTGAAALAAAGSSAASAQAPAAPGEAGGQGSPSPTAAPAGGEARALAGARPGVQPGDRVIVCNEDSNTLSVIDPNIQSLTTTINLTSFDEDPRPPFRLVTGGVTPAHAAMIVKPLYHGAIHLHGAAPSPDNRLLACTGRGSSNLYLVDLEKMALVGNAPNPQAGATTNSERITTGVLVGREPHEPTFTRNGKEIWVAVRGTDRIAILDTSAAIKESAGVPSGALRAYYTTIIGPAQVWFSADGTLAFVVSQKIGHLEVIETQVGSDGYSRPKRVAIYDIGKQDGFAFTPFEKTSPDGKELWLSHKLADSLSAWTVGPQPRLLERIELGRMARPNHVEFVENSRGRVVYASLARVDDDGPGGVASSRIAIVDRSGAAGTRKVVGDFFSHGREAHGLWTNPENSVLYVSHEQDQLPGTPNAGQTVCTAFDVSDPLKPAFVAQIPLGEMKLPSGTLRNKKSINLVYVRPGSRSQTG